MGTWFWLALIIVAVVGYLLWKRWTASIEAGLKDEIDALDASFGEPLLRQRLGMSVDEAVVEGEKVLNSAVDDVANTLSASATDNEIRRALTMWFDTKASIRPADAQSMDTLVREVRKRMGAAG